MVAKKKYDFTEVLISREQLADKVAELGKQISEDYKGEELFLIGSELDVFHDPDELMYKTAYYLSHDEARQRMAING